MSENVPVISPAVKKDHLFLISETERYTYGDLSLFGSFFLNRLGNFEISADTPLGICASSCDELVFIIAACWIHGIPFVPFSTQAKPETLAQQINEINPALIITDLKKKNIPDSYSKIGINEFDLTKIDRTALNPNFNSETSISPDQIFGYFFTSGTSGKSKIVPLKRRQIHAGAKASEKNFRVMSNEAWLLCMPINHIGGISVILRSSIYGSAIYRLDVFDKHKVTSLLSSDEHLVAASLVPTMLKRLLSASKFRTHQAFKAILLGGGPIDAELLETCINQNIPVIPSYGMTETCAQIAANPLYELPENRNRLKSVGTLFSPNAIKILDKNHQPVDQGASGTIWLKGPQVFDGYASVTADKSFDHEGWFNTGDFGRLDNENQLYIEARRTDLIITGGENVSPVEVETVLQELNFIKEAAIFGMPDPEWGQKVVAAVVFEGNQVKSEQKILKTLKGKIEPYKLPKKIIHVAALPRTETGKIKREDLEHLWENSSQSK